LFEYCVFVNLHYKKINTLSLFFCIYTSSSIYWNGKYIRYISKRMW